MRCGAGWWGLVLGLLPLAGTAQIYKFVDENGRVTYSNVPIRGAKKIDLDPLPTMPAPSMAPRKSGERASSPESAGFPSVDAGTQRRRDDMRRKILEDELNAEQQLLTRSRQNLVDKGNPLAGEDRNAKSFLDRIQPLKDNIALHEKNIEQIKREMANLK